MFRLLVVEDDRELNRAVCTFLGKNGYEAQGCLNALKQPANGGYIDRPLDTGKVEVTLKVSGIGGMDKFG